MSRSKVAARGSGRRYMMAMVLGTALSALGSPGSAAASSSSQISGRAVADISRYCSACWRNARLPLDRWGDCTQEVFHRLLQTVPPPAWEGLLSGDGDERREFFRAIDAVKKRSQRDLRRTTSLAAVVTDDRDAGASARACERAAVDQAAGVLLSVRQQRILRLSFEGWSVQDIAGSLELPAERVSDEKYKAVRKLREHFCVEARS
jgi:RNA polymerase sigma factor (sigma-70 family)